MKFAPNGCFVSEPLNVRFWRRVKKSDGCWEWSGHRFKNGYGSIRAENYRTRERRLLTHRVFWELANGPIPPGMLICHKCDNPPCVRPDHLFLGTYADNLRDMADKGRKVNADNRGSRNPAAKLCADDVLEIRRLRRETDMRVIDLAHAFNVSKPLIEKILSRKVWSHLEDK